MLCYKFAMAILGLWIMAACVMLSDAQLDIDLKDAHFPTSATWQTATEMAEESTVEIEIVILANQTAMDGVLPTTTAAATPMPIATVPSQLTAMNASTAMPIVAVPSAATTDTAKVIATTSIVQPVVYNTTINQKQLDANYSTTTTPPAAAAQIGVYNSDCILLELSAQLNITYKTKNDTTAWFIYNIPIDAVVQTNNCEHKHNKQLLQVLWGTPAKPHLMELQFQKHDRFVAMTKLRFVLPLCTDHFPLAKDNQILELLNFEHHFWMPVGMSYRCNRALHLKLHDHNNQMLGIATLHYIRVEAFRNAVNKRNAAGKEFARSHRCFLGEDDENDDEEKNDCATTILAFFMFFFMMSMLSLYIYGRYHMLLQGYYKF